MKSPHKIFILMLLSISMLASAAGPYILTDEDKAIIKKSQNVDELAKKFKPLVFDNNSSQYQAAKSEARQVFEDMKRNANKYSQPGLDGLKRSNFNTDKKTPDQYLIFASLSMKEKGMRSLLEIVSNYPNATVVLRGVVNVDNFAASILDIQNFAQEFTPMPSVIIDPTLFKKHAITTVPTIIRFDENGDAVASIKGIYSPKYLQDKIDMGEVGDLGVHGPVTEILERDLIEVMKEKTANIDWAEKKEAAKRRYWHKQNFLTLRRAPKARIRRIDPTIVVQQDILTPDKKVIARKGLHVNPLRIKKFGMSLVIFNPTDKDQIEMITARLPELRQNSNVMLIATQFDRKNGWDGYEKISKQLGQHVYQLTAEVKSRFELQYSPAIVTAENYEFVVEEMTLLSTSHEEPAE
jgi:conjugal transfer pilus assembly protein TraW